MSFKLINPNNARRHDYSNTKNSPHITHMIISMSDTYTVKFRSLNTHGWTGTMRTCEFVNVGDFIYKAMESKKIGVYEIINIFGFSVVDELDGEPFRDYKCEFIFCGYLSDNGETIALFDGYGVYQNENRN